MSNKMFQYGQGEILFNLFYSDYFFAVGIWEG